MSWGKLCVSSTMEGLTDHAHLLEGEDGLVRLSGGGRWWGACWWWTRGARLLINASASEWWFIRMKAPAQGKENFLSTIKTPQVQEREFKSSGEWKMIHLSLHHVRLHHRFWRGGCRTGGRGTLLKNIKWDDKERFSHQTKILLNWKLNVPPKQTKEEPTWPRNSRLFFSRFISSLRLLAICSGVSTDSLNSGERRNPQQEERHWRALLLTHSWHWTL